jgi:hypothetical protein
MAENSKWLSKPVNNFEFKRLINGLMPCHIAHGPWIAGGSIRKLWQGVKWKDGDIDFFFKSRVQCANFRQHIDKIFTQKVFNNDLNDPPLITIFNTYTSDNAASYDISCNNEIIKIQTIFKQFHETAEDMINTFDFTVCQFISDGNTMWATQEAVDDLNSLKLRKTTTTKNKIKIGRALKYTAYGFEPNMELMLPILNSINGNVEEGFDDDY